MIFDPSGQATFSAPLRYEILASLGKTEQSGYVHFMYFNLDTDDVKVFLSKIKQLIDNHDILLGENHILLAQEAKHPDNFLVMSVWQTSNDYYEFKNTPALASVKEFIRRTKLLDTRSLPPRFSVRLYRLGFGDSNMLVFFHARNSFSSPPPNR